MQRASYGYKVPATTLSSLQHSRGPTVTASTGAATTSATTRVKTMERGLRAEILSNAQRRYEAAARDLWLRTQVEVQAQVKALVQLQPRSQEYLHTHACSRGHTRTREWPPVHPVRTRSIADMHTPTYLPPSRAERYSPIPRPSSHAQSPSPNTPTPMFYRFRQVPKQPDTQLNVNPDANEPYKEGDLGVEELKRRYYEQLSSQPSSRSSRVRYYRNPLRFRDRNAQYAQGGSGVQVRTMADEYLDYYMPARRGPQSGSNYRQADKRAMEERHFRDPTNRSQGSGSVSGSEDIRRSEEPPEPARQRDSEQSAWNPQSDKNIPVQSQSQSQPQSSKSKLTFLLNPSEPGDSDTRPQMTDREKVSDSHCQRYTWGEKISSSSKRKLDDDDDNDERPLHYEQSPRANYARPAKRKATPPPSLRYPEREEGAVSDGEDDDDEAPRAKRRAFGRLPEDSEHESQSDFGPEEEERDDVYAAQFSEPKLSNPRSESRRKTTSPDDDGDNSNEPKRLVHSAPRHNNNISHSHPATSNKAGEPEPEAVDEDTSERRGGSEESKKYYFRPRTKANSG